MSDMGLPEKFERKSLLFYSVTDSMTSGGKMFIVKPPTWIHSGGFVIDFSVFSGDFLENTANDGNELLTRFRAFYSKQISVKRMHFRRLSV